MKVDTTQATEIFFSLFMSGCVMALIVRILWEFIATPKKDIDDLKSELNELRNSFHTLNLELLRVSKRVDYIKNEGNIRIKNMQTLINNSSIKFKELNTNLAELQTNLAILLDRSGKK